MGIQSYYELTDEQRVSLGTDVRKMAELASTAKILEVDETHGVVIGLAIVCKIDGEDYYDLNIDKNADGTLEVVPEHIPEDTMFKAALDFMQNAERPGNEMHKGEDKGTYVFAFPLTTDIAKSLGVQTRKTGLLVGYRPPADVLDKFRSGEYTGFSIEGLKLECEDVIDA